MTRPPATPFDEGDPFSLIAFVGEAPSYQEIRESRPFVGPAGQLFERLLHSAQIVRATSRIINVFEQPVQKRHEKPEIYDSSWNLLWKPTSSNSPGGFTEAGLIAAAPALARLRASRANVICALGGPALHLARLQPNPDGSITQNPLQISKWRGSIVPGVDGRKVVATFHPASCLRGAYENRYYITHDLRRVRAESASPLISLPQRNLIINPTFEQSIDFLRHCLSHARSAPEAALAPVATDIELLSGQISCFSLAINPLEAISIPLVDETFEHRFTPEQELRIWQLYAELIGDSRIAKVNQNLTFDYATLLFLQKIIPRGITHDPMVAFSVRYPFLEKNLGVICSICTREPYYKDDGTVGDVENVKDFTRYWRYSALDSAIALESWNYLRPEIIADGYWPTYELTLNMMSSLIYMMDRGTALDEKALAQTKREVSARIADLVKRISDAIGRPVIVEAPKRAAEKREAERTRAININSPKQLCDHFYRDRRVKPYTNQGGKESIDDKALARIFRRDKLPEAKLLQEYRAASKLLGTYLEVGYDRDGRLRSSYNIRGTWTGRLSSGKTVFGTGMNGQNLAPEFLSFLVSDLRPNFEEIEKASC